METSFFEAGGACSNLNCKLFHVPTPGRTGAQEQLRIVWGLPQQRTFPYSWNTHHACGERERLDDLLAQKNNFTITCILLEQLKLVFAQSGRSNLEHGMQECMRLTRQSKVPEFIKFSATKDAHLEGILKHADHPISSDKLEGTNKLAKVIKRDAHGFVDDEYFFIRLIAASRRPYFKLRSFRLLY